MLSRASLGTSIPARFSATTGRAWLARQRYFVPEDRGLSLCLAMAPGGAARGFIANGTDSGETGPWLMHLRYHSEGVAAWAWPRGRHTT